MTLKFLNEELVREQESQALAELAALAEEERQIRESRELALRDQQLKEMRAREMLLNIPTQEISNKLAREKVLVSLSKTISKFACTRAFESAKKFGNTLALKDAESSRSESIKDRFDLVKEIVHSTLIPKTEFDSKLQDKSKFFEYLSQKIKNDLLPNNGDDDNNQSDIE